MASSQASYTSHLSQASASQGISACAAPAPGRPHRPVQGRLCQHLPAAPARGLTCALATMLLSTVAAGGVLQQQLGASHQPFLMDLSIGAAQERKTPRTPRVSAPSLTAVAHELRRMNLHLA